MAVTHIIPKVNTSKTSEIRDHQGSDTRLSPVNLATFINCINFLLIFCEINEKIANKNNDKIFLQLD